MTNTNMNKLDLSGLTADQKTKRMDAFGAYWLGVAERCRTAEHIEMDAQHSASVFLNDQHTKAMADQGPVEAT